MSIFLLRVLSENKRISPLRLPITISPLSVVAMQLKAGDFPYVKLHTGERTLIYI